MAKKTEEIDDLFAADSAAPAKPKGKLSALSAAPAAPSAAPAKGKTVPAAPAVAAKGKAVPAAASAVPAAPVKGKVPARAAAPAVPPPAGASKGGRSADEPRGVPGVNIFGLLRQVFSAKNGATQDEALAGIRAATDGVLDAKGEPYSEAAMKSRVNKFLVGALQKGHLEKAKEKDGMVWYRYTGEVALTRGTRRAEAAVETPAPAPVAVAKRAAVAKK